MADFDRAVIVGVGLLGGSIGLALRERGLAKEVVGVGRNPDSLAKALEAGAVGGIDTDLKSAVSTADLVVVCVPVQKVVDFVRQCSDAMRPSGLITDVGSTKSTICRELGHGDTAGVFCGAHPLAGSDKSGVEFAEAGLFEGRTTVVTPTSDTPELLARRTESFWQSLGCRTVQMTPEQHDLAVAQTSHLPHVVAAALAEATAEELLPLAASGWCDTTRVASGNVEMWLQIFEENRQPVLDSLRQYSAAMDRWIEALASGDRGQLEALLKAGKERRDSLGN